MLRRSPSIFLASILSLFFCDKVLLFEPFLVLSQAKRKKKGIPLLAANLAHETFGRDDNALTLFDDSGVHELPRAPKIALARQLVEHIAKMLPRRQA